MDASASAVSRVLGDAFFDKSCCELASALLGKILVRHLDDGTVLRGRIVETEAYPGGTDRASHTFNGKTKRNAAMFEKAGTVYVYLIYGMYHCLNFSAKEPGAGVLIRALEPFEGLERMKNLRRLAPEVKVKNLCNGPGRLSQAFDIRTSDFNMHDLTTGSRLWIESDPSFTGSTTIACSRIGIDSCGPEWSQKPWRYYIFGNICVSKRNKTAELTLYSQGDTVFSASTMRKKHRKHISVCSAEQKTS